MLICLDWANGAQGYDGSVALSHLTRLDAVGRTCCMRSSSVFTIEFRDSRQNGVTSGNLGFLQYNAFLFKSDIFSPKCLNEGKPRSASFFSIVSDSDKHVLIIP